MGERSTQPAPLDEAAARSLARECDAFCRYLSARPATPYVLGKYTEGHLAGVADRPHTGVFDDVLVRVATSGTLAARIADAYARVFDRGAVLRRKLVLLLAILENTPPTHAAFAPEHAESPALVIGRLVASGLAFVAALTAGLVLLLPAHALVRVRTAHRGARGAHRSGGAVVRADIV